MAGMMSAAHALAQGFGTLVAGRMMDANYYTQTYLIMAVVFAFAAMLFLNVFRPKEQEATMEMATPVKQG